MVRAASVAAAIAAVRVTRVCVGVWLLVWKRVGWRCVGVWVGARWGELRPEGVVSRTGFLAAARGVLGRARVVEILLLLLLLLLLWLQLTVGQVLYHGLLTPAQA